LVTSLATDVQVLAERMIVSSLALGGMSKNFTEREGFHLCSICMKAVRALLGLVLPYFYGRQEDVVAAT
jgi:hypothetical protein